MTEPDVNIMALRERPRKYSVSSSSSIDPDHIEKITVPPSTELIPDEYKHEDNSKGLVYVFHSSRDEGNVNSLKEALSDQEYNVLDENIFIMSTKKFVMDTIEKIAKTDHTDKTCLIVICLGNIYREDRIIGDDEKRTDLENTISIRDIWAPFTSDNCPSLKYKPKVFIFQTCKIPDMTDHDGMIRYAKPLESEYDIPAEADILLIYKKIEDPQARNYFIEQLCDNLDYEGHKDDIIGLVTHTKHEDERRPLIISTLTRKFYVRPSKEHGHRGHRHDLHVNNSMVVDLLQEVRDKITAIQEQQHKFKKHLETRRNRNIDNSAGANASTSLVSSDGGGSNKSKSIKSETNSRRVSRTAPSHSEVDSKPKQKKVTVVKKRPPWRY